MSRATLSIDAFTPPPARVPSPLVVAVMLVSALALGSGCGGDEEVSRGVAGGRSDDRAEIGEEGGARPGASAARPQGQAKAPPASAPPRGEPGAPIKQRDLPESAFVETDENRDPFRAYVQVFNIQALPVEEMASRVPVLLEEHSLDALRLIAIVSGAGGQPRAMVVDPGGKGWVVRRGDYVGRGERVRLGPGQPEREINWRVVRIGPDRVVLVREDPGGAGPQVTRVMHLYPEEETT